MKKILRRTIYLTLRAFDLAVGRPVGPFILCYHSISDDNWRYGISRDMFESQMKYLADSGFKFVSLKDIEAHIRYSKFIPQKSVAITFDDGYQDILKVVPIMKYYAINPTVFVLGNTRKSNRKELGNNLPFLSKRQIKSLIKHGWEIGGHGMTHADFHSLDKEQIKEEVVMSKKVIEKAIGQKVSYFAYPKGKYSGKIEKGIIRARYKMALSMDNGKIYPKVGLWSVPRVGVDRSHNFEEFKAIFMPSAIDFRRMVMTIPFLRDINVC